jgi:hypothetical protein
MTDGARPPHESAGLDDLLRQASDTAPDERISLRDPIAAFGDRATEAMTDWLGDARLGVFAIRVLERIGREEAGRAAVVESLRAVDRDELPGFLVRDVDAALRSLAAIAARRRAGGRAGGTTAGDGAPVAVRPVGLPGVDGRGYWVIRTSPHDHAFIWAEALGGRLRHGWGWEEAQNLDVIAETIRLGGQLSDEQGDAWRARLMRTADPDGMRPGDIVVAPSLPDWGLFSIFRVAGTYTWDPVDMGSVDRYGHVLPVELLVEGVDRRAAVVSDALRAVLRPQTRVYSIRDCGGDVESVIRSTTLTHSGTAG